MQIPYKYTRYTFSKNYNTPVTRAEFEALRTSKRGFLKSYRAAVRKQFQERFGWWTMTCFCVMACYFIIGIGIPIMAISGAQVLKDIEQTEYFTTVIGILCVLGFLALPTGWGYLRSAVSMYEYLIDVTEYYERQCVDVTKFVDYDTYLAFVHDRIGVRERR